jgi:hypothetical protein
MTDLDRCQAALAEIIALRDREVKTSRPEFLEGVLAGLSEARKIALAAMPPADTYPDGMTRPSGRMGDA